MFEYENRRKILLRQLITKQLCRRRSKRRRKSAFGAAKPNAKSYVLAAMLKMLPIAIIWLIFDGAFIVGISIGMSHGQIPLSLLGFIIPFFLLHLMPVWMWIFNTVKAFKEVKNLEYAITDRRVIIRSGVIGIDFKFVNYTEIDSVNIKVGFIDKIFKVGDIYINSSVNSAVLWDVSNPYKNRKSAAKGNH